jgi:hypothetical protein
MRETSACMYCAGDKKKRQQHGMDVEGGLAVGGDGSVWQTGPLQEPVGADDFIGKQLVC